MATKRPPKQLKSDPRDRKINDLERSNRELTLRADRLEKWLNASQMKLERANTTIETLTRMIAQHVDNQIDRDAVPIPF